jgi:DNA-binding response OmpR family regulator
MAKVFLTGIEESVADFLKRALAIEKHQVEHRPSNTPAGDFLDADIVFAGGDGKQYLSLLREVRKARPALPFIVVTRIPETSDWLDALEAGATDYCSAPFELRQINFLMESAILRFPNVTSCAEASA